MNFFKTKPRTPPDLVRGLRDALPKLDAGPPGGEVRRKVSPAIHRAQSKIPTQGQANDDVAKNLQQIKSILYGAQNFYAFMIMLLFMTYNGWVMVSVAVGAAMGYYLFGEGGKVYKETACH